MEPASRGVIELTPDRLNGMAEVLAGAFRDDPLMRHLLPDDGKRARVLPWFLGSVGRYAHAYGLAEGTADLGGIACWLPPGRTKMTPFRMLRSGMMGAPLRLGPGGFRRLLRFQAHLDRVHARIAPDPHWYLCLLGVAPDRQGAGIGATLLTTGLTRADAQGLPCYLETQNERNLGFYRRHGFAVVDEGGVDGLRSWALRREPPAAVRADA